MSACNRSYRSLLWKADPHCSWCLIETVPPAKGNMPKGQVVFGKSDDLATLDHVHSKGRRRRLRRLRRTEQTVLACYHCNFQRNNAEQKERELVIGRNGFLMTFRPNGEVLRDGESVEPLLPEILSSMPLTATLGERFKLLQSTDPPTQSTPETHPPPETD